MDIRIITSAVLAVFAGVSIANREPVVEQLDGIQVEHKELPHTHAEQLNTETAGDLIEPVAHESGTTDDEALQQIRADLNELIKANNKLGSFKPTSDGLTSQEVRSIVREEINRKLSPEFVTEIAEAAGRFSLNPQADSQPQESEVIAGITNSTIRVQQGDMIKEYLRPTHVSDVGENEQFFYSAQAAQPQVHNSIVNTDPIISVTYGQPVVTYGQPYRQPIRYLQRSYSSPIHSSPVQINRTPVFNRPILNRPTYQPATSNP